MASFFLLKVMAGLALIKFALSVQVTLGGITCEQLKKDKCAFAISSDGKRCVLEKIVRRSGAELYTCRTSEIEADHLKDWLETDQCIEACGLDRDSLGISSDSLLESRFTQKLCSPRCYDNCPNIVDLYFNLAAGEGNPPIPDLYFNLAATQGVFLPQLCEAQGANAGRKMSEIRSSGFAKPALQSDDGLPVKFVGSTARAPN